MMFHCKGGENEVLSRIITGVYLKIFRGIRRSD